MQKTRFDFIWTRERTKDSYIPLHQHKYYELVYYPHGAGITNIDDKEYRFSSNTFAIIPPNTFHDELHLANSEVICLGFSYTHQFDYNFHLDATRSILKLLKEILHESTEQALGYQQMISNKLEELFIQIQRIQTPKNTSAKSFDHIINYLEENYHEKIQLSSFAEQLNISYDYFQHKFKEITGNSPQQFLLEQRLNAAKTLLITEHFSCTEITYRCGFSTPAQFSMLFKKKYGVSPKKFPTSLS